MAFDNLGDEFEQGSGAKWDNEDGDQIEGTVLSVSRVANKFNPDKIDINVSLRVTDDYVNSTEDGGTPLDAGEIRMVYGSRGSLRAELERRNPQAGDTLMVKQEGTYTTKNFKGQFPNYETAIKRAQQPGNDPWGNSDE